MASKATTAVIGFSAFNVLEDCYEYNENACYIADSPDAAESFMENSFKGRDEFRVDAVTIAEIMRDYGASSGEFAMEGEAFRRFSAIAAANAIRFRATPYEGDASLMIVNVEGVALRGDA